MSSDTNEEIRVAIVMLYNTGLLELKNGEMTAKIDGALNRSEAQSKMMANGVANAYNLLAKIHACKN